jgi:hypothetical protein
MEIFKAISVILFEKDVDNSTNMKFCYSQIIDQNYTYFEFLNLLK